MRDQRKSKEYFEESLAFAEESLQMFEEIMPQVIEREGIDSSEVRGGFYTLNLYAHKKANVLYSMGAPIREVRDAFLQQLGYYAKVWDPQSGYLELIRVLALCVLLEIEPTNPDVQKLQERIRASGMDDDLVNLFMKKVDPAWELEGTSFHFPGLYENLREIILTEGGAQAKDLEHYLNRKWYRMHRISGWYDNHKRDDAGYFGYWAFEVAAIAKIQQIEDDSLKDHQYYPYDLVHWEN